MGWLSFRQEYFSGKEAFEKENWEKAKDRFSKALSEKPSHPETLCFLAQALWNLGKKSEAQTLLEKLLNETPDLPFGHFLLGKFSAEEGDYEHAKTFFEKAVQLDPKHTEAWHELGKCLLWGHPWDTPGTVPGLSQGCPQMEALPAFRKVTELDPFITPFQLALLQEKLARAGKS